MLKKPVVISYRYRDIWHEYRDMKFCPYRSALVNSVVRLFPGFKIKKDHTSTQYVIAGLQPAGMCEWGTGLWEGEISPYCPWRWWWNGARGSTALQAEIDTKLLLLRLLFTVPKHWPTAPHLFLEVAGLPCSINGLIHSAREKAPKTV